MANTWETLDRGTQMQLCKAMGARTPEDMNRIAQHLAQNPQAVDRALKESGLQDPEEDQELQDNEDEESLESNMDDMMAESASSDVQETGEVASKIPPFEPGETIEEYIHRLASLRRG